jgi:uncharacterized protein YdhG (YjbR/CyaY superfamily)
MRAIERVPENIDEYIANFTPEVQSVLKTIRKVARRAAPDATEVISYRMPALKQHGMLIYFAAFKHHIGFFPPIRGDARLEKAVARYAGEKGNLRFPLDKPIPYTLIARLTKLRVRQDMDKAALKKVKKKSKTKRAK